MFDRQEQRRFTDTVAELNRLRFEAVGDPEIQTRVAAYEMAYRMQTSAPELMDVGSEPARILQMYGADPAQPSFANNALLARRLVERGVRFVQLYHTSWDQHGGEQSLEEELPLRCKQVDQASAALVKDLKQRGMLDDTLVIWGGEFGRTPMGENQKPTGRDHHVDAFTLWLAGGGIKPGITYGKTDEFGFSVVDQRVHVHDLQATILHLLGLDHTRLTFRFQGRGLSTDRRPRRGRARHPELNFTPEPRARPAPAGRQSAWRPGPAACGSAECGRCPGSGASWRGSRGC